MITLNNKDADFIAQVMRDEIESSNKGFESAMKDIAEKKKHIELGELLMKFTDNENNEEVLKAKKECEDSIQEAELKIKTVFNNNIAKYNKVIELVMIGSDNRVL